MSGAEFATSWIRRLSSGTTQLGMWAATGSGYVTEICAGSGVDWLLIDEEHAPNDLRSILEQLQVLAGYPEVEVVVRPPSADPVHIKQLLDIGVQNLLVPMVDSAAQATAVVAATRYPPAGVRGVGSALARASRWNRTAGYLAGADRSVSVTAQVESLDALAALTDIADVDGVDAVFIGPADLAASMGRLGQPGHPDVVTAIVDALRTVAQRGKPVGVNAFDPDVAGRYRAAGASFVLVGADVTVLARGTEQVIADHRRRTTTTGES